MSPAAHARARLQPRTLKLSVDNALDVGVVNNHNPAPAASDGLGPLNRSGPFIRSGPVWPVLSTLTAARRLGRLRVGVELKAFKTERGSAEVGTLGFVRWPVLCQR